MSERTVNTTEPNDISKMHNRVSWPSSGNTVTGEVLRHDWGCACGVNYSDLRDSYGQLLMTDDPKTLHDYHVSSVMSTLAHRGWFFRFLAPTSDGPTEKI